MHPLLQPVEPGAESVPRSIQVDHTGSSAVDQQPSHIGVSPLTDGEQRGLATGRVLGGSQAEPGCHIASSPKLLAITDRSQNRGRPEGSDARHGREAPRQVRAIGDGLDFPRQVMNACFEHLELIPEIPHQLSHGGRQVVGFVGQHL